jgi:hypothetical protein
MFWNEKIYTHLAVAWLVVALQKLDDGTFAASALAHECNAFSWKVYEMDNQGMRLLLERLGDFDAKILTSWDDQIEAIEDKVVWTSRVCKVNLFQLNVAIQLRQ